MWQPRRVCIQLAQGWTNWLKDIVSDYTSIWSTVSEKHVTWHICSWLVWEAGQEWKASPPLKWFLFCFWQTYRKRVWLLAWTTKERAESLPKILRIRNWIHASKHWNDNSSMKYLLLSIVASWYSLCASWLLFIKINNWDCLYLALSSHVFAFFSSLFFWFWFSRSKFSGGK